MLREELGIEYDINGVYSQTELKLRKLGEEKSNPGAGTAQAIVWSGVNHLMLNGVFCYRELNQSQHASSWAASQQHGMPTEQ